MNELLELMKYDTFVRSGSEVLEDEIYTLVKYIDPLKDDIKKIEIILNDIRYPKTFACPILNIRYSKDYYITNLIKKTKGDYKNISLLQKIYENNLLEVLYDKMEYRIFVKIEIIMKNDKKIKKLVIAENESDLIIIDKKDYINEYLLDGNKSTHYLLNKNTIYDYKLKNLYGFSKQIECTKIIFIENIYKYNLNLLERSLESNISKYTNILYKMNGDKLISKNYKLSSQLLTVGVLEEKFKVINKGVPLNFGMDISGTMAIMTLYYIYKVEEIDNERLYRATLFSYLVTSYIKAYFKNTSKYCSRIIAEAIGLSSGILYIKKKNINNIKYVIKEISSKLSSIKCKSRNRECMMNSIILINIIFDALEEILKEETKVDTIKESVEELIFNLVSTIE